MTTFQLICGAVLVVTYGFAARRATSRATFARNAMLLAVGAWVGEQSCIELYRFYTYADSWWVRLGHVPLLVPLIWPVVIARFRPPLVS